MPFGSVQTITLTLGQLVISKNLVINGTGVSQLTISGNNASRVFSISSNKVVTISSLTVTNGRQTVDGPDLQSRWGGGILNSGDLALINVSVTGNRVQGIRHGEPKGEAFTATFG